MKLEHIIFAGDSAGGHLTLSVAMLCALRGFRPPDSIFSHYPVVVSDFTYFFPSTMLAVDEWLLSEAFMSCVLSCFLRNGGNADKNAICSPILAPDRLLNMLPRVYMTCCEADILRDHAILFLERLLKADKFNKHLRTKLFYMKEYVHGFVSFEKLIQEY